MTPGASGPAGREGIGLYVLAWLVACAILLVATRSAVTGLAFPDPDDTLRLVQVRDWLAGQSWFDLRQYRMNAPEGAPMHWSRLVDVPIAAVILLLRPFVGTAGAEIGALVAVPLLTLGAVLALVAAVTRRLLDRSHAVLAAFILPVPAAITAQLRPLRIDHHGWQMALAMAALLATFDTNKRRSGVVSGALAAIWLSISMEGLPFAAALVALAAVRWLSDPREDERLAATVVSLAGVSLLLFALTKDAAGWTATFCDGVSPVHLAGMALGAAGSVAIVRSAPSGIGARLAAMATLGAAVAGVMLAVAPQCAAGPFEQLDPLVYNLWYLNVREGLPLWHQTDAIAFLSLAFPLIGLVGGALQYRNADGGRRAAWFATLFLLAAATATAIFVQRATGVAHLFAIPGAVALFRALLKRIATMNSMPARLAATLASFALIAPGHAFSLASQLGSARAQATAKAAPKRCLTPAEIGTLNQLPASDIAAQLDIGPTILAWSHHRIIASAHHRNGAAMRDSMAIFISPPARARELLAARSIDYVVVCPGLPELGHYKRSGPNGLWAELEAGRTPDWLEPVALPGARRLRVWQVEPWPPLAEPRAPA